MPPLTCLPQLRGLHLDSIAMIGDHITAVRHPGWDVEEADVRSAPCTSDTTLRDDS